MGLSSSPARYRGAGFLAPVSALSCEEAARAHYKHKPHLMLPWVSELVNHAAFLGPVDSILGPDVLCWTTNSLVKEAGAGSFVSFDQDSHYWVLTA